MGQLTLDPNTVKFEKHHNYYGNLFPYVPFFFFNGKATYFIDVP